MTTDKTRADALTDELIVHAFDLSGVDFPRDRANMNRLIAAVHCIVASRLGQSERRADLMDSERLDAARMRAICDELDANRRGVSYNGMPIWDAMCDAVGDDRNGEGMRAAIDAACAGKTL